MLGDAHIMIEDGTRLASRAENVPVPGQGGNAAVVAVESANALLAAHVPQLDCRVGVSNGQSAAIFNLQRQEDVIR